MSNSPYKMPEQQDLPHSLDLDEQNAQKQEKRQFDFPSYEHQADEVSHEQVNTTQSKGKNKIILGIGVLVLLGAGFFAYQSMHSSTVEAPPAVNQSTPPPATPVTTENAPVAQQEQTLAEEKVLIEESVLEQPIAEDPALQEEEIAKLSEIEKQLEDQKMNLEAQSQDVDELIRLKEEQIKLLEAELAKKQAQ